MDSYDAKRRADRAIKGFWFIYGSSRRRGGKKKQFLAFAFTDSAPRGHASTLFFWRRNASPSGGTRGRVLEKQTFIRLSEKYLLAKVASLPPFLPSSLPPLRMTSVYPGHALIPRTARRTPAGNGFVLQGPWGARSRGWRPSRAGPFSHGQLLHSRRVSEGKTWTWNDPTKQSPPWVHPQAKAPVPLTPKFFPVLLSLSLSLSLSDLFFQLDQYIFQRGITPSIGSPSYFQYPPFYPSPQSPSLTRVTFRWLCFTWKHKCFFMWSDIFCRFSICKNVENGPVTISLRFGLPLKKHFNFVFVTQH